MKLLTKEEENAHYREVVKGGTIGGILGLIGGAAGVLAFSRRSHTIRNLTLPMKSFLVTSSGTFVGIVAADHSSRAFEAERNASLQWYENREKRLQEESLHQMSLLDRAGAWARREKYKIVGATWIASMIGSFALVGRNPYLSGQQKIVQARVYAQGLTLAVLVASAGFEIADQKKGKGILDAKKSAAAAAANGQSKTGNAEEGRASVNQKSQEQEQESGLWKEMVAAEEERLRQKHKDLYTHEHEQQKATEEADKKEEKKAEAPKKEA